MERWDDVTCQAYQSMGFGSVLLMSGLATGIGLLVAFSLGVMS